MIFNRRDTGLWKKLPIFANMKHAPVALFVYNRADNTRHTLEALLANEPARETDLYVFSDGGRDTRSWAEVNEVRQLLHQMRDRILAEGLMRSVTLVERPENIYLERNITEGIAQVLGEHDRIIVLEDDIVTSPHFLTYMNEALHLYAAMPRVMHVTGFTNLYLPQGTAEGRDFYFTPHMSGWGWATWRDRWQPHFHHYQSRDEALQGLTARDEDALQYGGVFPCLHSLDKRPIPWDICWEIGIYRQGGLCLTPCQTLVRNIGLRSGTHFRSWSLLQRYEFDREPKPTPLTLSLVEQPEKHPQTEALFAQAITNWGIRYTALGKIARFLYKKICTS